MTTVRLLVRQHRWVVIAVAIAALGLAAAGVVAWSALSGHSTPAHCIEDRFLDPIPPECVGTEEYLRQNEELAGRVMAAMAVLPLLGGILLGAPLVASEIETRTATIAWSLGPSRRRWLAIRIAILGLGFAAVLIPSAIAADMLAAVRPPQYDMSTATLVDYGLRGPIVVFRGLAAFAIAVAAGLALGRTLPALLVAGVGVILLWNVVGSLQYEGWPAAGTFTPREDQFFVQTGDSVGAPVKGDAGAPQEVTGIPGEKLAFIAWREAALLTGLTIILLGGSVILVERRRPA